MVEVEMCEENEVDISWRLPRCHELSDDAVPRINQIAGLPDLNKTC